MQNQRIVTDDLLLFDKLLGLTENTIYKNHICKYYGCTLSYTSVNWNFNELLYTN